MRRVYNAELTIGLSWDNDTLYDNGGNECPLTEADEPGLRTMIESWIDGPLSGSAAQDFANLGEAINSAKAAQPQPA